MSTTSPSAFLRPEASPLGYKNLSKHQKLAFEWLANRLTEAAGDLPSQVIPSRTSVITLDHRRKTRVGLLSGGRGVGKTSVLLSLVDATINSTRIDDDPDLARKIDALRPRLVWLPHLDMSPLPALASLFSAILVRLDAAAKRLLQVSPDANTDRNVLDTPDAYDGPLAKLKRLQTSVAVSWEGNLKERAGHMDVNAFAAEVWRTESIRLDLNERVAEVLDALAAKAGGNPLFVLPIDDFDLNPRRCLELLELLRTISVPRLFFVVLGDAAVAEMVCGLQIAGDLAGVSGNATEQEFLPIHPQEVQALAANVAGNVLRKLLPPMQRFHLDELKVEEALKVRPVGSKENEKSIGDWLKEYDIPLDRIPVQDRLRFRAEMDTNKNSLNLYSFLFAKGWKVIPSTESRPFYSAQKFLELPFRHLVDLWFTLSLKRGTDAETADRTKRLRDAIHSFTRDVLAADSSLSPEARRRLTAAFDLEPDAGWAFSPKPFKLTPARYPYPIEDTRDLPEVKISRTIRAHGSMGWEFRDDPKENLTQPLFLSPATTSLMIFYTDLVALTRGEPNPLFDSAAVAWYFAAIRYTHNGKDFPYMSWPFPPVYTFWEADLFTDGWYQLFRLIEAEWKSVGESSDVVSYLVFQWINLGTALLAGEAPKVIDGFPTVPLKGDWDDLARRMDALCANSQNRPLTGRVRRWVADVASLLNNDVLLSNDEARSAFQNNNALKTYCNKHSKRFMEIKQSILLSRWYNVHPDELNLFYTDYRLIPEWWKL